MKTLVIIGVTIFVWVLADIEMTGPSTTVPEGDGIYKVSDGGLFSAGIVGQWIQTAGPRPGSTQCTWARLNGDKFIPQMIIDTGTVRDVSQGPVDVHVEKSDYAFYTEGCQPWHSI